MFSSFLLNLNILEDKGTLEFVFFRLKMIKTKEQRSHRRLVQSFSLQLPVSVDVLLRDLGLKLGCLRLRHLHAVQGTDHLDVPLCRKDQR